MFRTSAQQRRGYAAGNTRILSNYFLRPFNIDILKKTFHICKSINCDSHFANLSVSNRVITVITYLSRKIKSH